MEDSVHPGLSYTKLLAMIYVTLRTRDAITPPKSEKKEFEKRAKESKQVNERFSFFTSGPMSYIARWTVSLFGLINFIGLVLMHKASIIPYLACLMNVDTTTLHHWSTTLFPSKIYYAYSLFQWNGYADIIAVIICTVGLEIRAWSMRELGRFFTFKLGVSKDQRVVQSGPYHFVRHPSYTGALLVVYSVTYLLIIPTVREFVLPLVLSILELNIQYFDYNRSITQTVSILIELLRDPSTYQILELFMFALMVFMSVLTVTAIRIPQEEKMLSDSFGKEWDKFAATRARLIPYLY